MKYLVYTIVVIILSGCHTNSTTNLDEQITSELIIEAKMLFESVKVNSAKLQSKFIQDKEVELTKLLSNGKIRSIELNTLDKIRDIVSNIEISNKQKHLVLECLKNHSNQSKKCESQIAEIMQQFSTIAIDHGRLIHNEMTRFILVNNWITDSISKKYCETYRTGNYFSTSPFNENDTIRYLRKGNTQFEISEFGEINLSIVWLSDCEYELKSINNDNFRDHNRTVVKILKQVKDGYLCLQTNLKNDVITEIDFGLIYND